ncbi:MAG: phytoene/squalene synthase family protein [Oligoflexus sp.]|nr:phytoene/squalene synthase family protein [Oligoflexus sp.]
MNTQSYSYAAIQKGSLSFSFASKLFEGSIRNRVVRLYAWCRYVDDQIDNEQTSFEKRMQLLQVLAKQSFDPLVSADIPPAIRAFRELRAETYIPIEHPVDLLKGMSMDLCQQRYYSLSDLEIYCYRVAGVVGLMMSHLMDVEDPSAYQHAIDLGLAMQLTNISRDVVEDARMGRIYLPEMWLENAGLALDPKVLLQTENHKVIVPMVQMLLSRAEALYRSGDQGLKFLPFRCALAVAIAREVYSAIGHEVIKRGEEAWNSRTWIPLHRKLLLGVKGVAKVLATIPFRFKQRTLHGR